MLIAIVFLLMLSPVIHSSSDCPRIANIECSCFNTSVVCNGTQENDSELQNLLLGLSNITDLQNLTLNIKKITFPMESPFKGFKLKSLSLGIGLDVMVSGFLDGLESSLLSLNLEHNKIEFFKNPLSSLHNLKELYLGFNDYDIIGSDNFVNLSNLEFLSISGNRIHSLDEDFLEHFPVIHTLILNDNNISSISDLKIISPTLRKLIAQNCSISQTLEKETLSGIANLRYADFSSNGIIGVDSLALNELHNLEILNLSYNNINDLNDNAFSSLYNLKELDLRSNQISRIAQNAFINLTQLKNLDLSGNKLHAIIEEYTLDLYSLERINLQNNEIKVIQRGAFNVSRNLQELLLEGNKLECVCDLLDFADLIKQLPIRQDDLNAITCSDDTLVVKKLIDVDFNATECRSEDEDDEYIDIDEPSSSASPTSTIGSEITLNVTDISSTILSNVFTTTTELNTISVTKIENINSSDTSELTDITTESASTELTNITTESTSTELTNIITESTSTELTYITTESTSTELYNITTESTITELTNIKTESTSTELTNITSESTSTFQSTDTISGLIIVSPSQSDITEDNSALSETTTNIITETTTILVTDSSTTERENISIPSTFESTKATVELVTVSSTQSNITEKEIFEESSTISSLGFNNIVTELTTQSIKTDISESTIAIPENTASVTQSEIIESESTSEKINITLATISLIHTSITEPMETDSTTLVTNTQSSLDSSNTISYSTDLKVPSTTPKNTNSDIVIHIKNYSISEEKLCIVWNLSGLTFSNRIFNEIVLKCGAEIKSKSGKKIKYLKCPKSGNDTDECILLDKKYLSNLYELCINIYENGGLKNQTCLEYNFNTITEIPPVPFKVTYFDVAFDYANSFAVVNWAVNKKEQNSLCNLKLILASHSLNYTEGIFGCSNHSHQIQNFNEHETFQICLLNFYKGHHVYYECKSSMDDSYEFGASRTKDSGYKNSSLIAVICLLIVVVFIIVVILLKKLLKKRNISEMYNVSAEERNVLRRISPQFQQEPCVRYSYTLKEPIDI